MVKKKAEKKQAQPANNIGELRGQIKKLKDELFHLQLDHEQRKLKNTSLLSIKRKEIARLLTTLRIIEITQ